MPSAEGDRRRRVFEPDDATIQALEQACLFAARRLSLHHSLRQNPLSARQLAASLRASSRRLVPLLRELERQGLIGADQEENDAEDTVYSALRAFPPAPDPGGDLSSLAEVICGGPARGPGQHSAAHQSFLSGCAKHNAPSLWEQVPAKYTTLLDIGGGHGSYSERWCVSKPGRTATVLDTLPLNSRVVHPQIQHIEADLLSFEPAWRYDMVLIANVLHLFGPDKVEEILCKASRGASTLMVVEHWYDRSPASTLFGVLMTLYTGDGRTYSKSEIAKIAARGAWREVRLPGVNSEHDIDNGTDALLFQHSAFDRQTNAIGVGEQ